VDGPNEMASTLTMTIVHLLDSEDTRCYIKPSVDVEVISFIIIIIIIIID